MSPRAPGQPVAWGALLVASIAAACASPTPPAAVATPPAGRAGEPEPIIELVPPPGVAPRPIALDAPAPPLPLDPPQAVMPALTAGVTPRVRLVQHRVRYGRGELRARLFVDRRARPGLNGCPLDRREGLVCGDFTISTTGRAPDEGWIGSPPPTDARPSPLLERRRWRDFSGGRDGVYALGDDQIDWIDEQGKISTLARSELIADWSLLRVIELGHRRLVVGGDHRGPLQVGELTATEPGGPGRLSLTTTLPAALVGLLQNEQRVSTARFVVKDGQVPLYGEPTTLPLPGPDEAWAMVWVEAVPPPETPPPDRKQGAKQGCGRPSRSRLLSSPEVEKRIHLTHFAGTTLRGDVVLRSTHDLDLAARGLDVRAAPGGVEIDGTTYAIDGRPLASLPRPPAPAATTRAQVPLASDESLLAAAFDPGSGQGLVVVRAGSQSHARRFDAEGRWLGEPTVTAALREGDHLAARIGGRWWLAYAGMLELTSVDDGTTRNPLGSDDHNLGIEGFVSGASQGWLLLGRGKPELLAINPDGTPRGPLAKVYPAQGEDEFVELRAIALDRGAPQAVLRVMNQEKPVVRLLRGALGPRPAWAPLWGGAYDQEPTVHRAWNDMILWGKNDDRPWFIKARSGQPLTHRAEAAEATHEAREVDGLLSPRSSDQVLTPSGIVTVAGLGRLGNGCIELPTGPRTVLFFCERASDAREPGARVTLRRLRLPP